MSAEHYSTILLVMVPWAVVYVQAVSVQSAEPQTASSPAVDQQTAPRAMPAVPGPDPARTPATRVPDKVLIYKTAPGPDQQVLELQFHVYLPEGWKAADRRPAIILWFGGGFVGGDPRQFFPQAEYFASRGMVGISSAYRVKRGVPVAVEDARSAMRWLKTHAAELGIDPNRIVAGGGSAGGYLAAAIGTNVGADAQEEDQTVSVRPAALVLFNPALRVSAMTATSPSAPTSAPDGAGKPGRAEMDLAPPYNGLDKNCPPAILFYGTSDKFIDPGRAFNEKGLTLGIRSELWAAPGQGHGFFNRAPWTQATLEKADLFLASLGILTGPPIIKVNPRAVLVRQEPVRPTTQPNTPP